MAPQDESVRLLDLCMIGLGCAMFAFGLVFFNIANHLADGGISGITLILRALFGIDPAYSTILINVPLILIGWRFLGRQSLIYTIYGTIMLSLFLWIWQRVPFVIQLHGDLLLSALGAGIIGGFGSGLLYRYGGTTGGTDIIARIFERFRGVPMGRTLLYLDVVVLLISLVYIDVQHMAYTLIYSYIFARIVNFTQEGAYAARGVIIISPKHQEIADDIMARLERGVSLIDGEGGYSHQARKLLYVVVAPSELHRLRQIIAHHDDKAFVSIINVNEALGEGFSFQVPKKGWLGKLKH
ncbi:MAG: YitT family protein [Levilactobacillus sp.]|uniref:YitT family protein n=1 Tax=Levilactobacillus sp. TaxID=2767919 RepID=UPI00258A71EB|nr:YitT family protein [Levilactobacillus sp.]MCH4123313.1 YitT family protein [Levilactobacillus sp.]MCI1552549.1 YitT family protein [Levilactobacillus sp.]